MGPKFIVAIALLVCWAHLAHPCCKKKCALQVPNLSGPSAEGKLVFNITPHWVATPQYTITPATGGGQAVDYTFNETTTVGNLPISECIGVRKFNITIVSVQISPITGIQRISKFGKSLEQAFINSIQVTQQGLTDEKRQDPRETYQLLYKGCEGSLTIQTNIFSAAEKPNTEALCVEAKVVKLFVASVGIRTCDTTAPDDSCQTYRRGVVVDSADGTSGHLFSRLEKRGATANRAFFFDVTFTSNKEEAISGISFHSNATGQSPGQFSNDEKISEADLQANPGTDDYFVHFDKDGDSRITEVRIVDDVAKKAEFKGCSDEVPGFVRKIESDPNSKVFLCFNAQVVSFV